MASQSRLPSIRRPGGAAAALSGKPRPLSMFEVSAEQLRNLRSIGESATSLLQNDKDKFVSEDGNSASTKQYRRRSLLPQFSSRKGSNDASRDGVPAATIKEDESEWAEGSVSGESQDATKAMPPPPRPSTRQGSRLPGTAAHGLGSHTRSSSKDSDRSSGRSSTPVSQASSVPLSPSKAPTGHARTGSIRASPMPTSNPSSAQSKISRAKHPSTVGVAGATHKRTGSTISTPSASGNHPSLSGGRPPNASSTVQAQSSSSQVSPPRLVASRTSVSKSQMPPPSKPSFSTYQQHYSPAKSSLPKPPVPTVKTTVAATQIAPSEDDLPVNFDILKDQIDLLQLSIMHQAAFETMCAYEWSAKKQLSQQHAKLRKDYNAISTLECEQKRIANLTSIETWCPDPALLVEHLQILSRVTSDIQALTESHGRYDELARTFETWVLGAEQVLRYPERQVGVFVEALPEHWKTTHTSLALKLRAVQHDIGLFPTFPTDTDSAHPSSLEILLKTCRKLVDGMLRELEIMMKIQKEVTSRGKAKVDDEVSSLLGSTNGLLEKESWAPAWQLVQVS